MSKVSFSNSKFYLRLRIVTAWSLWLLLIFWKMLESENTTVIQHKADKCQSNKLLFADSKLIKMEKDEIFKA